MWLELSACEEAFCLVVGAEERLHFPTQLRVVCTCFVKEPLATFGWMGEGGVIRLLDPPPAPDIYTLARLHGT